MGYGMNGGVPSPKPGMSPRKEMAGGTSGGNFGVDKHPGHNATKSADLGVGTKMHMPDSARAVGMPVAGGGGMHPSQAAPAHGPMHASMDFKRGGKV